MSDYYRVSIFKEGKWVESDSGDTQADVLQSVQKEYNLTNDEIVELLYEKRIIARRLEFNLEPVYEDDPWDGSYHTGD